METFAHLFPSEKHHSYESGFKKKRKKTFNCKRSAENVTDKPGVAGPVCSEFKFQNYTGSDCNSEVDAEEAHPETCNPLPFSTPVPVINCLHDCQDEAQ